MLKRTDKNKKVTAVLPAYNAERTLERTVADIPRDWVDEIILVDDASRDGTVALAEKLGLVVIRHAKNRGYGGNQKTCYAEATKRGADVVVMVHPDYQYDPTYIPGLIAPILEEKADAVFGSRMFIRKGALEGRMPYWKFFANIFLTTLANIVLGYQLSEYHSGFRAYSRQLLSNLPLELNSDDFVFDSEIIVQCVAGKYRIAEVPIPTRYFKEASSIGFWKSVKYGLNILWVLLQYRLHRVRLLNFPKYEKVAMAPTLKPEAGR
ncbi:MAG: glycosyltransferase family 2 protein [candidate division Zixibacteria bacterium]|nr:glycosyltransferase family 2 protein [candidate division Zixibacteria bacterium]